MLMNDLISIVLPVYNGERFLRESIESVLNQTYKNWELIIVDDCSTDNTSSIAKEYENKDARVHYYKNEKNLRLPGNLNKGFSLTHGDYLTWTSDDNRYKSNALEKMIQALKSNTNAQLVYASYQIIDESGNTIGQMTATPKGKQHILGENVVGACFLYTREAMNKTGEYDTDLFLVEDFDYWQRMLTKVESTYIAEVLYEYRWHSQTLTSTKNEKKFGKLLEKNLKKNRPLFGQLDSEAEYYYFKGLYGARKRQGGINIYAIPYYYYMIKQRFLKN